MMPANNWHCDARVLLTMYISLGIFVSNWAKIEWESVLNVEWNKKKSRWHCYGYASCPMRIVELVIVWENLKLLSLIMRFWCFILFVWYLNNTNYVENPFHINPRLEFGKWIFYGISNTQYALTLWKKVNCIAFWALSSVIRAVVGWNNVEWNDMNVVIISNVGIGKLQNPQHAAI